MSYFLNQFVFFSVLKIASNKLKEHYIDELIEWIIEQPLNPNQGGGVSCMSREDAYVDLSVFSGETVDSEWHNSDREAIMDLEYLKRESICLDQIWEPADQLVLVRGVAGIGKSTMINRYVLKWAREEILTDASNNEKIDFLFFLECRELNTKPNMSSLGELLKEKYPRVFRYLDLTDLQNIADRVMIVVDGLDELQGVYDENNQSCPTTQLIKKVIDAKSSFLKGHRTIACGRPKACEFIKSKMNSQKTKLVEVCGFDEKKTMEYIDHFFRGDLEKANKLKEIIKRPNPRVMSSVPVLLWVMCLLYSEDFDEEINTTTELYTYGLFVFLKEHLRGIKNLESQNLATLVCTLEFGQIVYSLSEISVKTYMQHKMVFTDDDIKDIGCSIHLEQSGLAVKHSSGKLGCEVYQFKHLAFQEYLCALFLCLAKGVSKYSTNRELSSCTPTILGIHRLINEGTSPLFVPFYQSLQMVHNASRSKVDILKIPYDRLCYRKFINKHNITKMIKRHIRKGKFMGRNKFECSPFNITFNEIIRNFRENGRIMDESILQKITECYIKVEISGLRRNIGSVEILEFLKSLKVQSIDVLVILTAKDEDGRFEESDFDLIKMTKKNSTLKIRFFNITCYSSRNNYNRLFLGLKALESNVSMVIPTEIKDLYNSYVIEKNPNREFIDCNEKTLENIFRMIANLIEEVLENDEKENLLIKPCLIQKQYKRLVGRIKDEFQHRGHFDKIQIDED